MIARADRHVIGVMSAAILGFWMSMSAAAHGEEVRFRDLVIPDQSGKAMTVLGAVDPKALGTTLMHEHLFIEYRQFLSLENPERWKQLQIPFPETEEAQRHWSRPFTTRDRRIYPYTFPNKDAWRLDSIEDAVDEVLLYKDLRGRTIVDVTSIGLGQNPKKLAQVARQTGVHIVMGTGFYTEGHFPPDMDQRSLDDLTYLIVRDIVQGGDGTSIKSGIIGEVGAMEVVFEPMEGRYVRSLRAAARASRLTGAAITLHARTLQPGTVHKVLDLLEQEGADLSRVVVGHVLGDMNAGVLESLLRRRVYLEFDLLGYPFIAGIPQVDQRPMLEAIVTLISAGYADRVLVSQDVCHKNHLAKHGGWGFTFVHAELLPYLRDKGVSEIDIKTILSDNPRRLLTFVRPNGI